MTFQDLFQTDPGNMDSDGGLQLTDPQIEDLTEIIVSKDMATIAIKYLGIPQETVENLRIIRQNDYMGFNRDLLEKQECCNQPDSRQYFST